MIVMKALIKFIFFIVVFCQVARFSKSQTDGFAMVKIQSKLTYSPTWDVPCPDVAEVKKILAQPFTYLGKGAQTYVFASQDGNYVIKLLRHDRMRAPFWTQLLPSKWVTSKIENKQKKLIKDFTSYKIAYEEFQEETGLIYLHLNKTSHLNQMLTLIDKIGIAHQLDLDKYEFLIQKRATLTYPALQTLIDQGETTKAKESISSLVSLLEKRFEKGIFDKDPDLNTNFGFIGEKAIQIDPGRYRKTFPESAIRNKKEAIRHISDHLHQWLQIRSALLDEYLMDCIESVNEN